jgi:hypothetical protein
MRREGMDMDLCLDLHRIAGFGGLLIRVYLESSERCSMDNRNFRVDTSVEMKWKG